MYKYIDIDEDIDGRTATDTDIHMDIDIDIDIAIDANVMSKMDIDISRGPPRWAGHANTAIGPKRAEAGVFSFKARTAPALKDPLTHTQGPKYTEQHLCRDSM